LLGFLVAIVLIDTNLVDLKRPDGCQPICHLHVGFRDHDDSSPRRKPGAQAVNPCI
jgi:hypothetical protein